MSVSTSTFRETIASLEGYLLTQSYNHVIIMLSAEFLAEMIKLNLSDKRLSYGTEVAK